MLDNYTNINLRIHKSILKLLDTKAEVEGISRPHAVHNILAGVLVSDVNFDEARGPKAGRKMPALPIPAKRKPNVPVRPPIPPSRPRA